jgi:hypothetical protein
MACSRCGSKKNGVIEPTRQMLSGNTLQDLYNSGEFVVAKYNGPRQIHNVGSPTGIIAQYNMTHYGRGRNGDIFLAHKNDIGGPSKKFIMLEGGAKEAGEKLLGLTSPVKTVLKPKAVEKVIEPEVVESEETDINAAVAEVEDIARQTIAEGEILTREKAIQLNEFKERHGFTHVLQVMAKVRSGELLSYKNEEDGKTYIYHTEAL